MSPWLISCYLGLEKGTYQQVIDLPGLTQSTQPADHFDYEEEDVPPKAKAKAKPAARQRTESAPKKPANGTKARKRPAARDNDTDEEEDIVVDVEDDEEDATPKKKRRKPATDTGGGPLLSPEMQAFLGVQRMNRFKVRHVGPICDCDNSLGKGMALWHEIQNAILQCSGSGRTSTAAAIIWL